MDTFINDVQFKQKFVIQKSVMFMSKFKTFYFPIIQKDNLIIKTQQLQLLQ